MFFNFEYFVKYKMHIGHSLKNTKLLSSWVLYKLQNNVWIINIFKTIFFFKNILSLLKYLISYNFPIWFINLELTKEFMFLFYSRLCGEFSCTRYWVRGLLSNYFAISKSIRKYGLKKIVYKSSIFLKIVNNWYITRYTWPRAVFLSSIDNNYIVCNEAISMFLPIIAIIDSNSKSFLVKFPIISNDDSIESFYYIFNIMSRLILLLKYKKLILWFLKYKKVIKEVNLKKLINYLYYIKRSKFKSFFKPINLFNRLNKNINFIEFFYKKKKNKNIIFNQNIAFFDFKLLKKKLFFKKYNNLLIYKCSNIFNNKLKIFFSKNIKNVLYSLKRFKKRGFPYFIYDTKLKGIRKYFSLYWSSFIYSVKNLRIFYNSFFFYKKKNYNFLNLRYFQNFKNKSYRYNYKFMHFPFFFFIKKRAAFFKSILKNYTKYNRRRLKYILFFYKKFYIKFFIELYYNKWFIYLLNSNL